MSTKRFYTHSYFLPFAFLWVLRFIIGIVFFIMEQKSIIPPPFSDFVWNQIWSLGEVISIAFVFIFILKIPVVKKLIVFPFAILLNFFIVWSIADPFVFTLAGDHLTPSLLGHFAGINLNSDYLWLPIKANFILVISALVLVIVETILMFRMVNKSFKNIEDLDISFKNIGGLALVSLVFLFTPSILGVRNSYTPEIEYVRDATDLDRSVPTEQEINDLRLFLRGDEVEWVSDEYPLVYKPKLVSSSSIRPDIFLIVIESLRAEDLLVFNPNGKLYLPGLEKFAQNGRVFPNMISNGFPSTEGFHSINSGTWPHDRRRVVLDFKATVFDFLPARMKDLGYSTVNIEDDPDFDEEGHWVRKYYERSITFRDKDIWPSEKNMIDSAMQVFNNRDAKHPNQPIFMHLKTRTPHYPYTYPDDEKQEYVDHGKPSVNYENALKYVDGQIERFYEFTKSRSSDRPLIVVITGDHANFLDTTLKTGLPSNDLVWSGLIISGPANVIGSSGVDLGHASQVDIKSTLMKIVGDDRPTASFGYDLLDSLQNTRRSVVVRPAGMRLDQNGNSNIVDARYPNHFYSVAFGKTGNHESNLMTSNQLLKLTNTWSYLIEKNRVWNDDLISSK